MPHATTEHRRETATTRPPLGGEERHRIFWAAMRVQAARDGHHWLARMASGFLGGGRPLPSPVRLSRSRPL